MENSLATKENPLETSRNEVTLCLASLRKNALTANRKAAVFDQAPNNQV